MAFYPHDGLNALSLLTAAGASAELVAAVTRNNMKFKARKNEADPLLVDNIPTVGAATVERETSVVMNIESIQAAGEDEGPLPQASRDDCHLTSPNSVRPVGRARSMAADVGTMLTACARDTTHRSVTRQPRTRASLG